MLGDYLQKAKQEYRNLKGLQADKICFQRNMTYGDFKYLPRKMASEKVLRDKAFAIAINSKFNG